VCKDSEKHTKKKEEQHMKMYAGYHGGHPRKHNGEVPKMNGGYREPALPKDDMNTAKEWGQALERAALDIERRAIAGMFNNMCQCPACGVVMEKISGDNSMMCGCEAKPAGGTMQVRVFSLFLKRRG